MSPFLSAVRAVAAAVVLTGAAYGVAPSAEPSSHEPAATTTTTGPSIVAAAITDGDTFVGSDGVAYRLAAIDAPESGTEWGPAATQRLTELLTGPLTIEPGEVAPLDRYGRSLAYVFAGETFVNEVLVREGLAAEAFYGDNVRYRQRYLDAQAAAQAEGLGMWSEPATTTTPPTTTTPAPTTTPTTTPPPPVATPAPTGCTPGYDPCIPVGPDVDCAGGSGNGPRYTGPVRVHGPDVYDLDRDGDTFGCE